MKLRKIKIKKIKPENILKSFYVFDTETTKLEPMSKNFVFGVIYGYDGYKIIKSVADFKKEFKKKKYDNKIIFAHNAEFDLLTIFGNLFENLDSKTVFNGNFIIAKHGKITFADSLNVLLMGVAKIGEKLGLKKLGNDKIHGEGLTKENMNQDDIDYCIRDCKIVYDALSKIYLQLGVVKITLASISLYDYRKFYLKDDLYYDEFVYDFFESYYGGRTEAFVVGKFMQRLRILTAYTLRLWKTCFSPMFPSLEKKPKLMYYI